MMAGGTTGLLSDIHDFPREHRHVVSVLVLRDVVHSLNFLSPPQKALKDQVSTFKQYNGYLITTALNFLVDKTNGIGYDGLE